MSINIPKLQQVSTFLSYKTSLGKGIITSVGNCLYDLECPIFVVLCNVNAPWAIMIEEEYIFEGGP